MADIPFPRGVRDLMPNEALFRNELLNKVEATFQSFGFLSIDTPAFESLKVLKTDKGIGEDTKLIYETDEGLGLRYDFTVSLARYVAMHQNVPLPFRRYAIGKCWRREEPQKLRYREFTQADIDIVGGRAAAADAEVMAVTASIFETVGLGIKVVVNNRKFVDALLVGLGIGEGLFAPITRAIDKLDKVGRDGVLDLLRQLKVSEDAVGKIDALISMNGSNEDKLAYVAKFFEDKSAIDEMAETIGLLKLYNLKSEVVIDFSLVRGFDYYTGIVFEYKLADGSVKSSLGGGGRYDELIGRYGKKSMPAVGSSIGIDRLLDMLDFSASPKYTYANVFVVNVKDSNYTYALQVAGAMRAKGIAVETNIASRNISNQLAYANSLKFKYAMVLGDEEQKNNNVKLRNLIDGNEASLSLDDAIKTIKGK